MTKLRNIIWLLLACDLVFGRSTGGCGCGGNCGCGSVKKNYYLSVDKANFFQAYINCKNGGMELASAEDEEESNGLDAYLIPHKSEGWDNGFWLSGTSLNDPDSKIFYWLATGHRAVFTKWIAGQNDNANGAQHCMTWVQFKGEIGWADDYCELQRRYVCETRC